MIRISSGSRRKTKAGNCFLPRIPALFLFLIMMLSGVTADPVSLPVTHGTDSFADAAGMSSAMQWAQAAEHAQFSGRQGHSTVVFDDSIWVIGGLAAPSSYYADVWRSDDGITWTQVTPAAAFGKRAGHRSVVFDNKIWVIGGRDGTTGEPLNDIWYSSDGITWKEAESSAPFAPRWSFGMTVFKDEIWVIGGNLDGPVYNDVWHSPDGANWERATEHAGFSPRMDLTATMFDHKIWVTGGFDWKKHYNDLWYSEDGITWTQITDHAPYPERRYQKTEVAKDRMWVIGGIGGNNPYRWNFLTDVWYSADGKEWTEATENAGFPPRYEFTTATFNDRLWVIGGTTGNDVWYSELSPSSPVPGNRAAQIIVTKTVSPSSIKAGTGTTITITVLNKGPMPVHDIEILDAQHPDFPVMDGIFRYSCESIGPDETRILTYRVLATKTGSFRLNRTALMYADPDGNYHLAYSGYGDVKVLPSLLADSAADPAGGLFRDFAAWVNGFTPFT